MVSSVAVIGAGVMGASIAAHVANAGVPVMLLDIVKPGRPTATRWRQAPSNGSERWTRRR